MPKINFIELNKQVSKKLANNEPFALLRIGNTECYVISCSLRNQPFLLEFFNENYLLASGVYPETLEYGFSIVQETWDLMKEADYLGFVDISRDLENSKIMENYFPNKQLFYSDENVFLDPRALSGIDYQNLTWQNEVEKTSPWTKYLKGKKVLVVSTHRDSILHQWKNIDKVWGDKKNDIVPFELVDVIRSPYHPKLDSRQPKNCQTWMDSVNYIKKEIEKYDFDILLAGSAISAPFYVTHAKKLGKVGIQTAGATQLFFGVKGSRWVTPRQEFKTFNENWIFPFESDAAQKRDLMKHTEYHTAYWK